ncbi:putative sodium/potassium/calcium exchanger CG1090 [Babylonia areolata]|uniref:putative sodium/potassium/calcium exchanger CG1090 n=1 Tax=Babylonia areolata TaxID=304850 RepID=UPI003FD36777
MCCLSFAIFHVGGKSIGEVSCRFRGSVARMCLVLGLDDVGLGTVVGSAIYNVMFVISMCALFATSPLWQAYQTDDLGGCTCGFEPHRTQIVRGHTSHWWPMVRDCIAYLLSVLALIFIIYDAVVKWYEAVLLIVMYVLYVLFMYFNERLEVWCVPRVNMCCCCGPSSSSSSSSSGLKSDTTILYNKLPANGALAENGETTHLTEGRESDEEGSDETSGFSPPPKPSDHAHQEAETWHKLCERPEGCLWAGLWLLALPLSAAMFLTVPDCRRPSLRKWFLVTFLLSLVWLSAFSFLMVWMITVIGFTANIPDSVMSLTFIAFGVSLPDVVASVLVVRDGLGDMAVSNAIGSNVFDILVCLGIPWFLETCVTKPGSGVVVYSEGLVYSSLMLLSTVAILLIVTHLNGWRLTKKYGVFLLVIYVLYTILASMYELNIFGYFHPPECDSSY